MKVTVDQEVLKKAVGLAQATSVLMAKRAAEAKQCASAIKEASTALRAIGQEKAASTLEQGGEVASAKILAKLATAYAKQGKQLKVAQEQTITLGTSDKAASDTLVKSAKDVWDREFGLGV